MNRSQRDGLIFLLISAAAYAFFAIFAKLAYNAGVAPLDLVTWRFLIATPVIWLLLGLNRKRTSAPAESAQPLPRNRLLLMGVIFALSSITGLLALSRIPASMYTVLLYSYPAIVALMSTAFGERLPLRVWAALALTLVGVALTVPHIFEGDAGSSDTLGVIFALLNAVFYSTYIVLSGRLLRGHTAQAQASAWSITGSLLAFLVIAAVRGLGVPPTIKGWGSVVGMALICSVVATFTFYAGMQRVGAARAAILSMFEPVIVLLLSTALLGERMLPVQVLGGAFILGSIVMLQVRRGEPEPRPVEVVAAGN